LFSYEFGRKEAPFIVAAERKKSQTNSKKHEKELPKIKKKIKNADCR
jgi:hypothetical protein